MDINPYIVTLVFIIALVIIFVLSRLLKRISHFYLDTDKERTKIFIKFD